MANPLAYGAEALGELGRMLYLTPAEKAARTRAAKAMRVPAVRRREEMRTAAMPPPEMQRNILAPADIQGSVLVPVVGDRSAAGFALEDVAGVPLERAVPVQGGPAFMAENAPEGVAWASMKGAAASKAANLRKAAEATGRQPIGVYSAMSPEAVNFSAPVASAMIAQLDALKPSKEAVKQFNRTIRKQHKNFVGVDDARVYDQMLGEGDYSKRGAGALRKTIVEEMSKAQWRDRGFPVYDDVVASITEPGLVDVPTGESGFAMFRADPAAGLRPERVHQSYDTAIPGEYIGGLQESIPPEVMFPQTFEMLGQKRNRAGQILPREQRIGAMRAAHLFEPANQRWVDTVSAFLNKYKGANLAALMGVGPHGGMLEDYEDILPMLPSEEVGDILEERETPPLGARGRGMQRGARGQHEAIPWQLMLGSGLEMLMPIGVE